MYKTEITLNNDVADRIIRLISTAASMEITQNKPSLAAKLPHGGARVQASTPPYSVDGPTFNFRMPTRKIYTLDEYVESEIMTQAQADFVTETLEKLGQVSFWKIAVKPGKPLAFGKINDRLFFGLPGNPVSVMATFALFVRPALQKLKGLAETKPKQFTAICDSNLKKSVGRKDHQRGIYFQDEQGKMHVSTTDLQGSHVLSSMSKANCFIVIPQEAGNIEAGEEVLIYPFDGLMRLSLNLCNCLI